MAKTEDEEYKYFSEKQVKKVISSLLLEIEKLRDENDSLWFMLEEMEKNIDDGDLFLAEAIKDLKDYKSVSDKKPEEA